MGQTLTNIDPGTPTTTAAAQQQSAQTMTDTYIQSIAFEAQITQIKAAGDSELDAVKQRPQI